MAFFKFRVPGRKAATDLAAPSAQAPSIEQLRQRARQRLIGAVLLVVLGVIGFPLLFDTQPRPIPVDLAIVIPDRDKVAALQIAPPASAATAAASAPLPVPAQVAVDASLGSREQLLHPEQKTTPAPVKPAPDAIKKEATESPAEKPQVQAKVEPKARLEPEARAEARPKPEVKPKAEPKPKPEARPEVKPPARADDDGARAQALLEGRTVSAAEPAPAPAPKTDIAGRFVVQVGAYTDAERLRQARSKVERAGLKTYTQVIESKDGKRTRVRVGPFASKAEAERTAARIKALELPASVLSL